MPGNGSTTKSRDESVDIDIAPFGPSSAELSAIGTRLSTDAELHAFVGHANARHLYTELIDEVSIRKTVRPTAPDRFISTFYDDANLRTVIATGGLDGRERPIFSESAIPPAPSHDEFATAVRLLSGDAAFAESIRAGAMQPYQPIPAIVTNQLPDGRYERHIAVGLLPRSDRHRHEIVAVGLADRVVHRFDHGTPGQPHPEDAGLCGVPHAAHQKTASKGTAGQVWVTVKQGGKTIWRFLAVRPAASSGTNGSGVELRFVDYKGKRLLYRAHVPVLNVKYDHDACGPYRDWQYQEGMIDATGTDVAPGFRLCPSPAKTIMDTGSDTGNFLGVAIYVQGSEVVLVSEMEAGWYRYVSQWRLAANGTIKPRFGFAAVESQCVCNVHHHHAYWRFDFDIRTAGNNHVREFNDPPLIGTSNWHDKIFEIKRPRDFARKRKWRVENTVSHEAYDIVPNKSDGVAATQPDAPYGRGDVWILRYHPNEIDDGSVAIGPPYEINIDGWVNGEAISNHDVVIWYGAHFTHDVQHDGPAGHDHIVGPDLVLVKW